MVVSRSSGPSRMAALVAAVAMAGLLAGCAPEAEPEPQQLFATEDEAFAAAEEVYRAYTDAIAKYRAGDADSDSTLYLVGTALNTEREGYEYLESNDLHLQGSESLTSFEGIRAHLSPSPATVEVLVCADISAVRLFDESGTDVTPADRPDTSQLIVTLTEIEGDLRISDSQWAEGAPC